MTRWPAICWGVILAISPAWLARSASCTLVGVAAGPCTASAACAAGLGAGGLSDGRGDADGLTGGCGDVALTGERGVLHPAPTPTAAMASPASAARPARTPQRR